MRRAAGILTVALLLGGCGGAKAPSEVPAGAALPPFAIGSWAPAEAPPWSDRWADGAVFYEVFVRSFADSDGDGVGDLRGLTERLDYLNDGDPASVDDLGVDALWLMPVFASPSYHGYDTTDYRAIDPDYGTLDDFRRLLDEAHRRGVRVIVDLVINHTSAQHPWFREASSSPDSPKRDWYVWRAEDPGWTQPWGPGRTWHRLDGAYYYGLFWGGMPDLNFRNPAVQAEIADIARYWLDVGVDGFRLDAARHIVESEDPASEADSPETLEYWRAFSRFVRSVKPDALLVGEVWSDAPTIARYYGQVGPDGGLDGLPMAFDFPTAAATVEAVRDRRAEPLVHALAARASSFPPGAMAGTFLTNHDMIRVATALRGDPASERLAAALLLTLPGSPFLYYGEEVGLQNAPGTQDEAKRTPMPWSPASGGGFTTGRPWEPFAPGRQADNVETERAAPHGLLARYRGLIALRHATPALRSGSYRAVAAPADVVAFERAAGSDRVVAAHNLGERAVEFSPGAVERLLWSDPGVAAASGGAWTLPARASAVWSSP